MKILVLLLATFLLSWGLTWGVRRYALSRSLMDIPNARSSHTVPTPRGGGVSIVLAFLLGLPVLHALDLLAGPLLWALAGGGVWVAVLGFIDDHRHVTARWRLLGHFVAAAWVLVCLRGLPPVEALGVRLDLGWLGHVLAAVGLVWLLNLYNFMDGIDGIASVQAISVCLGGALLYWLAADASQIWPELLLISAVGGFLCWNFPPARIFMGDAGSGFLGLTLGVFALHAAWIAPGFFWAWLILLGVFVVDATWTLVHRLIRRERVYEAHRSHAYQFAARQLERHLPVTVAVALINLLWLLPVAILVVMGRVDGIWGLLMAYTPLAVLAWYFEAGAKE